MCFSESGASEENEIFFRIVFRAELFCKFLYSFGNKGHMRHDIGRVNGKVEIFSDSAYLINCCKAAWWKTWARNGWKNSKKQPVANQDLWERLIPYFKDTEHFTFTKVKGHAGDRYNEQVDGMAVRAREAM
jgi:hypothetical protein